MGYQNQALRTECETTPELLYRLEQHNQELLGILYDADCLLTRANIFKRGVYYGKFDNIPQSTQPNVTVETARLLHAALGLVTEGIEFLQLVTDGDPFDPSTKMKMIKELGDSSWFKALACSVLGETIERVDALNIIKLRERYPEKYSDDLANNRDETVELSTMEKKFLEKQ